MNRKGLDNVTVGGLIVAAIGIIVALTLLTGGISGGVGQLTTTGQITNVQITAPAVNATTTLTGQAVSGFSATNGTTGVTIPSADYAITNYIVSDGKLISTFKTLDGGAAAVDGFAGKKINVTYTYEPFGYDTNGGGRAIAGIIIIFCAIAIAIVTLVPILRSGLVDF